MNRTENLPPVYTGPTITQIAHNVSSTETIVQLKCSGCTKWTTGNLNVQSTSANLIYAWCSQPPFTPSDPNSGFDQHDDHGNFNLNLKAAQTTTATAPPPLTNTPTSSGGLSYRQKVYICLNDINLDYLDPRVDNGFRLGRFVPYRRNHHPLPRQSHFKRSHETPYRPSLDPPPPRHRSRNRYLPSLGPPIHSVPYPPLPIN